MSSGEDGLLPMDQRKHEIIVRFVYERGRDKRNIKLRTVSYRDHRSEGLDEKDIEAIKRIEVKGTG